MPLMTWATRYNGWYNELRVGDVNLLKPISVRIVVAVTAYMKSIAVIADRRWWMFPALYEAAHENEPRPAVPSYR